MPTMVPLPRLMVVTGCPGSGKSTFSRALGAALGKPVLHRDNVKKELSGLAGGAGASIDNAFATSVFFDRVAQSVDNGEWLIVDAAFQHAVWSARLAPLATRAWICVIVCCVSRETNRERRHLRAVADPHWLRLHPDPALEEFLKFGVWPEEPPYDPPQMPVPTLELDTTPMPDRTVPSVLEWLNCVDPEAAWPAVNTIDRRV